MDESIISRRDVLRGASVGGLALAVPFAARPANGSTDADALRIGTLQPPVTLDPVTATSVGSMRAIGHVFDGLYTSGEDATIVPKLAAGPPKAEGDRTVRVGLTAGAEFQNGEPVTATDVKYSFEAPLAEDTAPKDEVSPVESVEVVDSRRVRFHLRHPYPAFEETLTRPIVPKERREADREQFAEDPVGAGPFEVDTFEPERRLRLTRWGGYWGSPAPDVSRVTVVHVESPFTAMMSLRTGRTDVVQPVTAQLRRQLPAVTGAAVSTREGYRSYYFGFNANEGPTTDSTVREAISHCIDLDEAVEAFVGSLGRRQYGPVPPQVADEWGFPRDRWRSKTSGKDVDRARALFAEADAEVGRPVVLTSEDPRWKEFGNRLARGIRDAGQAAVVKSVGWGTYLDRYVSGAERDYAVFVGEVAGTDEPDSYLYPVVHENMQGLTNGIFYNEETVMNALSEARRTTDRARRQTLYTSVFDRLLDDHALLPICSVESTLAAARSVSGLDVHADARLNPRLVSPTGAVSVGGDA